MTLCSRDAYIPQRRVDFIGVMTESHRECEERMERLSLQWKDLRITPDMEVNKWRFAWMNQYKPPRKGHTRDVLILRYEEARAVRRREEEGCDEEWETDESEDVEGMEGRGMRMRMRGFGRRRMRVREYVPWEKGVSV